MVARYRKPDSIEGHQTRRGIGSVAIVRIEQYIFLHHDIQQYFKKSSRVAQEAEGKGADSTEHEGKKSS